jgi:uncharacterized damage-inducible protein DinB
VPATADGVRELNADLDRQLLEVAATVPAEALHRRPAADEWSPAELLAHLGEFPHFFAAELRRWRGEPDAVIGRTHDSPVRLAAVADPPEQLAAALDGIRSAFADLTEALADLRDEDLTSPTNNVRYGAEPLTAFLDRYVVGHKAGHVDQLRRTLTAAGD